MSIEPSQLLKWEQEENLFEIKVNDIPVWERVRVSIFKNIKRRSGLGQAHSTNEVNKNDYIYAVSQLLKNSVVRNPYFASKSDIMFFGGSRKKQDDGDWWDIYFDSVRQQITLDSIHLERSPGIVNTHSIPMNNVRYTDLIKYGSLLARKLNFGYPDIPNDIEYKLHNISEKINQQFDTEVDVHYLVERSLHLRNLRLNAYKRLIKQTDPKVVIILPGYGNETLIEACNHLDIPIVEFQHGVISKYHFGYAYPGDRKKEFFADYLFTFGEFWGEQTEFPIPNNRVIPVGYPHLEQSVEKYKNTKSLNQILFISQGTIGEELSKFAVRVAQHPEIHHNVVYKLHPGEYNRWQEDYPWLRDVNFRIIDSNELPLHRLFAESRAQVGVYSTAIFEGLNFNLDTYIYDGFDSDVVNSIIESGAISSIIEQGAATKLTTGDELASDIKSSKYSFDSDYYFKSGPIKNIENSLNSIINSQSET